jgi:hypothetical protein
VPLEAHLKINTLRMLRTQGYNRPLKEDASATVLGNTSSILVPSYTQPHSKISVQASDPFDAPKEAERTRRRISELERLDPKPFFSGGKTKILEPPVPTSVHAHGLPFVEAWKRAQTERELADTSAEIKQKRVSTLPFVGITGPLGGRTFEELERHKAAATAAMLTAVKQHATAVVAASSNASAATSVGMSGSSASASASASSALAGLSIPSGSGIKSPTFKPKSMQTTGAALGHVTVTSNTKTIAAASAGTSGTASPLGGSSVPPSPSRAAALAGVISASGSQQHARRPSAGGGGALDGIQATASISSSNAPAAADQQGGLLPVPKAGRRAAAAGGPPAALPPRASGGAAGGRSAAVAGGLVSAGSSVVSSANPSPSPAPVPIGGAIKKTSSVASSNRELTSAVAALEEAEGGADAISLLPQAQASQQQPISAVRAPLSKRKGGEGAPQAASSSSAAGGAVYAENEDYGGSDANVDAVGSVASLGSAGGGSTAGGGASGSGAAFKRVSAIAEAGSRVLQQQQ